MTDEEFEIYEQGESADMDAQENIQYGYQSAAEDFFSQLRKSGVSYKDAEKMIQMFVQYPELAKKSFEFAYR